MVQPETRGSALSIGDVIDGRYRVQGHLGSGGMGDVWLVEHKELLQTFALKTLKPELLHSTGQVQRFLREARAAAALNSRHIVRVVDGRSDYEHHGARLPFIVMEHLKGVSVEQRVTLHGPCSVPEACWLLGRLALALGVAHEGGLVHRDVKPANVFIAQGEDGEPIVKLGDFGIVKLMDDALFDESSITASGAFIGTPMYMAPEQLRAQRDIGPQADQWSFAMLAFYVLTGRSYFSDSDSVADLIAAALSPKLSRPSLVGEGFPTTLDAWFLKSCAQAPRQRFGDVAAQMKQFHRLVGSPSPMPIGPHAVSRPAPSDSAPNLHLPTTTLLIGAGLAFALMGAALWHHGWLSTALLAGADKPAASDEGAPRAEQGRVATEAAVEHHGTAVSNPTPGVKPSVSGEPNASAVNTSAIVNTSAGIKSSAEPRAPKSRARVSSVPTSATTSSLASPSRKPRPRAPDNSATVAPAPSTKDNAGTASQGIVPSTRAPSSPPTSAPSGLQPSGAACTRSAECQSGLCVAERCR